MMTILSLIDGFAGVMDCFLNTAICGPSLCVEGGELCTELELFGNNSIMG